MNQPLALHMDKAAFYRWVVEQEGRFELENGVVQQMTGTTKTHGRIVTNFIKELSAQLDAHAWSVTACDLAVEIGNTVRYPDVVVERLDAPGGDLVAEHACLLVEVLSPSSVARDMRLKAQEYKSLPRQHTYIVASQDDIRPDGAFPAEPDEIVGADREIAMTAFDFALPLSGLYRGTGRV
jgi:Uma2 family endonuclease